MKTALKVLFSRLDHFFIKNNRAFVVRDETSSDSSNENEFIHEEHFESPYLNKLLTETMVKQRIKKTLKEPTSIVDSFKNSSVVKLKTRDGIKPTLVRSASSLQQQTDIQEKTDRHH